jgi:hypothetical protein
MEPFNSWRAVADYHAAALQGYRRSSRDSGFNFMHNTWLAATNYRDATLLGRRRNIQDCFESSNSSGRLAIVPNQNQWLTVKQQQR